MFQQLPEPGEICDGSEYGLIQAGSTAERLRS